jgi:tetratricopeptide (TPR) repeat protein
MHKVFVIEDHDEALKVWRRNKVKGLDLVHVDAHIDFGFHPARPIEAVLKEARNLKELKKGLEYSLAFKHYESDFEKQTNIGNYIYPAMVEGRVRNFYWVIPGGLKEFKESLKNIKTVFKTLMRQSRYTLHVTRYTSGDGSVSANILGRKFSICILERLPVLKQKILLDIDTDFLVIDSLLNANNTIKIGKRKPWIFPKDLVDRLKKKIKQPEIITIAYSVNGGYTPIKYKYFGDEIAYYFNPKGLKRRFENNSKSAEYFNLFNSSGGKEYYQKATKLNLGYRVVDNNYGPLYLTIRKFFLARKEFLRILRVDPKNPACLLGMGNIALEKRDFKKAKECFSSVLNSENNGLFAKVKSQGLLGLAKAEFNLGNFRRAKGLLFRYKRTGPLQPQSYYLLGRIFEQKRDFARAVKFYQDAIRLGLIEIKLLSRLLKLSRYIKGKYDIIFFLRMKYEAWKRGFLAKKKLGLKRKKKIRNLRNIEEKMAIFEKRLENA